jgi:hypothetical protein
LFIFDLLGNLIITGSALYGNHRSRRAQVPRPRGSHRKKTGRRFVSSPRLKT